MIGLNFGSLTKTLNLHMLLLLNHDLRPLLLFVVLALELESECESGSFIPV